VKVGAIRVRRRSKMCGRQEIVRKKKSKEKQTVALALTDAMDTFVTSKASW